VSKPDLIELSTDWDTAVLVADRYTGLNDGYIMEHAKQLLAAVLLIANKEGRDYASVNAALQNQWRILEPIQRQVRDGPKPETAVAVEVLRGIWGRDDGERGDISATAYVLFLKAVEPRSAFDLDELPEPRWLPPEQPPSPYA
jgi:hypothetical protein